jgi:hypothetical protein
MFNDKIVKVWARIEGQTVEKQYWLSDLVGGKKREVRDVIDANLKKTQWVHAASSERLPQHVSAMPGSCEYYEVSSLPPQCCSQYAWDISSRGRTIDFAFGSKKCDKMKRIACFLSVLSMGVAASHLLASRLASGNRPAIQQSFPTPSHTSGEKETRTYLIRVIDTQSRAPVAKAKITVQLDDPAKTKRSGYTDSNGVFQFKWDAIARSVKTHISIEARGFMALDDYSLLIEDRVIPLNRADWDVGSLNSDGFQE